MGFMLGETLKSKWRRSLNASAKFKDVKPSLKLLVRTSFAPGLIKSFLIRMKPFFTLLAAEFINEILRKDGKGSGRHTRRSPCGSIQYLVQAGMSGVHLFKPLISICAVRMEDRASKRSSEAASTKRVTHSEEAHDRMRRIIRAHYETSNCLH